MHARTAACAALLTVAALTAGCSSGSSNTEPNEPATVTATKTVDQAAARQACVDAWAELLQSNKEVDVEDEPAVCATVPGQSAEMYTEALLQRNKANRDELDACLDDPTCTDWPVPSP